MGVEPTTYGFRNRRSTIELLPSTHKYRATKRASSPGPRSVAARGRVPSSVESFCSRCTPARQLVGSNFDRGCLMRSGGKAPTQSGNVKISDGCCRPKRQLVGFRWGTKRCPFVIWQGGRVSNPRHGLRRTAFYPLNYLPLISSPARSRTETPVGTGVWNQRVYRFTTGPWCPRRESNPHTRRQLILSQPRLPFRHLGIVGGGPPVHNHSLSRRCGSSTRSWPPVLGEGIEPSRPKAQHSQCCASTFPPPEQSPWEKNRTSLRQSAAGLQPAAHTSVRPTGTNRRAPVGRILFSESFLHGVSVSDEIGRDGWI